MRLRTAAAAMSVMWLAMSVAHADTRVFAHVEGWEAFGGTANTGRPVCGISSRGLGKYFGLKYFSGSPSFTIQLGSKTWRVGSGAKQRVSLQFDRETPWNGLATGMHFGNGEAGLEFNVNRNQLSQFVREFRGASELLIRFPESNANSWRASLSGTDVIVDSLAQCMRAMR